VEGHAAHRHRIGRVLLARGEHQVEQRRRALGVGLEELVEITHPKEQQRIARLPLQLAVLAHHRRLAAARLHARSLTR
jgi:hypothetical protein